MAAYIPVLVHLLLLFHIAASTGKGSGFRTFNQYKTKGPTRYGRRCPIEYMKTPNFDVMLLSEENSDPTWRTYSQLFQPNDLRNVPQIQVNFGSNTATFVEGFRRPSIRLDRSEVESVLALLGNKKHIIVLHPRDCKPDSTIRGDEKSSLDEFENEFLPKLLQQLHKPAPGTDMMDPVIDRILASLDNDERKMLNELSKTFETRPAQYRSDSPMYSSGYTTLRRRPNGYNQYGNRTPQKPPNRRKNLLMQDPCNEGYVFLVQNQQNSKGSSSLNDLILRVVKVVTESS